jgi:hypothetical protein
MTKAALDAFRDKAKTPEAKTREVKTGEDN